MTCSRRVSKCCSVSRAGATSSRPASVKWLDGKWSSNSHGARPVRLIITIIKLIRTSRLSIKSSGHSTGTWSASPSSYRAHPWSPFPLRRAHLGLSPHTRPLETARALGQLHHERERAGEREMGMLASKTGLAGTSFRNPTSTSVNSSEPFFKMIQRISDSGICCCGVRSAVFGLEMRIWG